MALQEIIVPEVEASQPEKIAAFLVESERRIDAFFASGENRKIPKFLPSNAEVTYQALAYLIAEDIPLGRVFCELGSGFGVAAGLAALLGYESYGIELEGELVSQSRQLAEDMGVDSKILQTSYLPEGFETYKSVDGTGLIVPDHHSDRGVGDYFAPSFEGMPHTTDEVDVYFVYPWPSEQHLMQKFFEILACEGAILLLHYGDRELRVYRRVESGEEEDEPDEPDEPDDAEEGNENEGLWSG